MNRCPLCQWDNEDPQSPGTALCANPQCGASYVWPQPDPIIQEEVPQLTIDAVMDFMGQLVDQLSPQEREALALQMSQAVGVGPKSAPKSTALKGDGKTHTTDPAASCVKIHVFCPDTSAPVRARPTIDGVPLAAGSGEIKYDYPKSSMIIETRAGNNDLLIIEEFE